MGGDGGKSKQHCRSQQLIIHPSTLSLPPLLSPRSQVCYLTPPKSPLPLEVLSLIESYLPPSSLCFLSATCVSFHERWSSCRWKCTFYDYDSFRSKGGGIEEKKRKDGDWRREYSNFGVNYSNSFVGCCCDGGCICNNANADQTEFNLSAMIPSMKRMYTNLWDTIELGFLGYYDVEYFLDRDDVRRRNRRRRNTRRRRGQWTVPVVMRAVRDGVLPDLVDYVLFVVGFKPLVLRARKKDGKSEFSQQGGRVLHPVTDLQSSATSMSAWKLACILKERGVDCVRCRICDKIDLTGEDNDDGAKIAFRSSQRMGGGEGGCAAQVWMTPCRCPELIHRHCLEQQLDLVPKLMVWEQTKRFFHTISSTFSHRPPPPPFRWSSPVWVSYDGINTTSATTSGPASTDNLQRFNSPRAKCSTCHTRYRRTFRVPNTVHEVLVASLSDPLAWLRALSTLVHFILAVIFIAATEGLTCQSSSSENTHTLPSPSSSSCPDHITLSEHPIPLLWPSAPTGLYLAWWQLQQCCMLHIFFSSRFAAVVDRLWMGPLSLFYCRLYLYFMFTSVALAVTLLPFVGERVGMGKEGMVRLWLGWVWDVLVVVNVVQYAVASGMVIGIFWRTNYRVYTVADGRGGDDGAIVNHGGQQQHDPIHQHERHRRVGGNGRVAGNTWSFHPIYHGRWQ